MAIGTKCGTLGTLDVSTHSYRSLLRSHTAPVTAMATGSASGRLQLATTSLDGTIRLWSLYEFEQLYEFCVPEEKPLCVACHPMEVRKWN